MGASRLARPSHRRVFGAALVGALVMFGWGAVSHMLLFKGAGFRHVPDEGPLVTALQQTLPGEGLYFIPSLDFTRHDERAERAWQTRFERGPRGMIVFHTAGDKPVSGAQVGVAVRH